MNCKGEAYGTAARRAQVMQFEMAVQQKLSGGYASSATVQKRIEKLHELKNSLVTAGGLDAEVRDRRIGRGGLSATVLD